MVQNKKQSPVKNYFLSVLIIFLVIAIDTFIHEFGHLMMGIFLGEDAVEMNITLFGYILLETGGNVYFTSSSNSSLVRVLINISGTLATLITGYFSLIKYMKNKNRQFLGML